MSYTTLPALPAAGRHEFDLELGGVEYTLTFQWHERIASWYLDIRDALGNPLRTGIRLAVDWPLYGREKIAELPNGILSAQDVSNESREIETQDELGARVKLVFIPRADVPAAPTEDKPTFTAL